MSACSEKVSGEREQTAARPSTRPADESLGGGQGDWAWEEGTTLLEPPSPLRSDSELIPHFKCDKEQYIALDDGRFNFGWNKSDLPELMKLWRQGMPGEDIAREFGRDEDETAVLFMSLMRERRILPRRGGWHGGKIKRAKGATE